MDPTRAASARLFELERILAHDRTTLAGERRDDPVALHLTDVPSERIRHFTESLRQRIDEPTRNDDIDILTMRLLLNDYTIAVGHLRAIAEIAAARIDHAAQPVRDSQRFLKKEQLREEKIRQHQAFLDRPDAP